MDRFLCPMSDIGIEHIKSLSASYKLAVDSAQTYNSIAVADCKQTKKALELADRLQDVMMKYLDGWEKRLTCLSYSCDWEYCKRNLQIADFLPQLQKLQENLVKNNNSPPKNNSCEKK